MAMHCPRCLTEYRDGFSECSECHVALAPGAPPATSDEDPDIPLVSVLETSDPFAVTLAKGTLEDAGIEYAVGGDDAAERNISGLTPAGAGASNILVEPENAAEALNALDPIIHPVAIDEESVEPSSESEL